VAELDEAVTWQSATLGVVAISRSRDYLHGLIEEVDAPPLRRHAPTSWARSWQTPSGNTSRVTMKFWIPPSSVRDARLHRHNSIISLQGFEYSPISRPLPLKKASKKG